jgi:hypothetical protein
MTETLASRPMPRQRIVALGAFAFLVAATLLLWSYYGTAVFFETVRAGLVACFG